MLTDEFERQGQWLFRWRSYVPLLLAPLVIWVISTHDTFLAESESADTLFKLLCLLVSLAGLGIRFVVHGYAYSGTSGRNTREQVADSLNTAGLYSVVRHPLYLGNIIMLLGIMLFTRSPLLCVAGVFGYLLFYERIIATEERFLAGKFGDTFRAWAEHTSALLPRWSRWVRPGYSFAWKRAIRAEFYGLLAVVAAMTFLDALDRWFVMGQFKPQRFWLILLGISAILFVVLRHLRKHTRLLDPTPSGGVSTSG